VRDGLNLLRELERSSRRAGTTGPRLTGSAASLRQLPVDPRMGRMVLEGERRQLRSAGHRHRRRAVDPGPARRPADEQAQADQSHARFGRRDSTSRYLNLWKYLREGQRELSATSSASAARRLTCITCACASGRTWSAS